MSVSQSVNHSIPSSPPIWQSSLANFIILPSSVLVYLFSTCTYVCMGTGRAYALLKIDYTFPKHVVVTRQQRPCFKLCRILQIPRQL